MWYIVAGIDLEKVLESPQISPQPNCGHPEPVKCSLGSTCCVAVDTAGWMCRCVVITMATVDAVADVACVTGSRTETRRYVLDDDVEQHRGTAGR